MKSLRSSPYAHLSRTDTIRKIRALAGGNILAERCLLKVIFDYDFDLVVDIGGGKGSHSRIFADLGRKVIVVDKIPPRREPGVIFVDGYFPDVDLSDYAKDVDVVWCSHCLEHQPNVNLFLRGIVDAFPDGCLIAITVPPAKDAIVGGHLTLWNAGLLIYNMIVAGLDCSTAKIETSGYDISIIVRKKTIVDMPSLNFDAGDIEKLAKFFPIEVKQGFDGKILSLNW